MCVYVDLNEKNIVYALDRDPFAIELANKMCSDDKYKGRLFPIRSEFGNVVNVLPDNIRFDGILFDLGCSSMQLDSQERGVFV